MVGTQYFYKNSFTAGLFPLLTVFKSVRLFRAVNTCNQLGILGILPHSLNRFELATFLLNLYTELKIIKLYHVVALTILVYSALGVYKRIMEMGSYFVLYNTSLLIFYYC